MPSASGPKRSSAALAAAEEVASPSAGPSGGARASGRTTRRRPSAIMPPLPAAVIECERAKLVTTMSARATGARAAQVRVEHVAAVLDHEQAVRVGDGADGVPVGAVADEVRREDRLGARADHLLDLVDVDLVRVGLDVDERGHDAVAHERRDVARERQRRRDHLVAGLAAEQVDRQPQRRRAGVHHHAVRLGQQLGAAPLELGDLRPEVPSPACSTSTTASISRSSCTGPASVTRWRRISVMCGSPCVRCVPGLSASTESTGDARPVFSTAATGRVPSSA